MPLISPLSVPSKPAAVPAGTVLAGERWRFTATGAWTDWFRRCGPDGYRVIPFEFLGLQPTLPTAPLFALVGMVRAADGAVLETIAIGSSLEHTFAHSGALTVSANDLPSMRWNNHGAITLTATQVAPVLVPKPDSGGCRRPWLVQAWLDTVTLFDRTPGFIFIAALLAALGFTLAFTQQGKDLVTAVTRGSPWHIFCLCVATVVLGFQAWFWARAIVEFHSTAHPQWRSESKALVWVPRLLGLLPFLFLAWAVLFGPQPSGWQAVLLTALAGALLTFLIFRVRIAAHLAHYTGHLKDEGSRTGRVLHASLINLKTVLLAASVGCSLASLALVLYRPVAPAIAIGPAPVVLLAAALVIPVVTLLIQVGHHYRLPTLVLLLSATFLFSLWNDNHAIRLLKHSGPVVAKRPTLEQAYQTWRKQFGAANVDVPIVFVAAPGGASRAGYWTAMALGKLEEDSQGEFSKHLFAISSISGSSVATVGFLASLADNPQLAPDRQLRPALEHFATKDFLSPALAGMFFPDMIQRFVPFKLLPDRAQYMEEAFEAGWKAHCKDGNWCGDWDLMSKGFLNLWQTSKRDWLPTLVIGGAREENGRRILTSNVRLGDAADADDFFDVEHKDVRLSTAIDNGARFPFMSPGGALKDVPGKGGHVVDGGYFDPAGVEVLREIAWALVSSHPGDHLRVIFIVLPNYNYYAGTNWVTQSNHFASDAFGPIRGLYNSREAHGGHMDYLLDNLKSENVCLDDGNCARIRVQTVTIMACPTNPAEGDFPMNWVLSPTVQKKMKHVFDKRCDNAAKIAKLVHDLTPANGP